jgi:hypothetical protein
MIATLNSTKRCLKTIDTFRGLIASKSALDAGMDNPWVWESDPVYIGAYCVA